MKEVDDYCYRHRYGLFPGVPAVARAPYAGWTRFDDPHDPLTSVAASDGAGVSPNLRAADDTDVPVLERCARAAYGKNVERIGREPAPMVADFASAVAQGRVRVVERTGRATGYAIVERRADALHLENVAVFPGQSGAGLGRFLVASVEDEARRLGLNAVTLYTNARMYENLALYRHLGYVETDRRSEDGFDRVYFEKRL